MRYILYFIGLWIISFFFSAKDALNLPTIGKSERVFLDSMKNDDLSIAQIFIRNEDSLYRSKLPIQRGAETVSAEKGKDIFNQGYTKLDNGGKSKRVSPYFVCSSCHNTQRENPILYKSDPQARLDYAVTHDIPFLQGTTMYGAINRETYYNDDYVRKYGDLVFPARNNIREAIQLCATECSQGRLLDDWELESLLAYYWSIGLKLSDLDISAQKVNKIVEAYGNNQLDDETLDSLKAYYALKSPATFIDPPENRKKGNNYIGDVVNGEKIYTQSCLHCHRDGRYSFFELDSISMDVKYLRRHLFNYDQYSAYQVVRYGTSPIPGKEAYMPNYPLERMSRQQMADLRAFILEGFSH